MAPPEILLVEDVPAQGSRLQQIIHESSLPYALKQVRNDKQAIDYLRRCKTENGQRDLLMPLAVLIGWPLKGRGETALLDWLRKQTEFKDLLVIALLSLENPDEIQSAYNLGATTHLAKPIEADSLVTILKTFAPPVEETRLLLLDDDEEARRKTESELKTAFPEFQLESIARREDLRRALARGKVGAIITEAKLTWTDTLAVLREVKSLQPDCPVIIHAEAYQEDIAVAAMENGLEQYVLKTSPRPVWLIEALRRVLSKARESKKNGICFCETCDGMPIGLFKATREGQIIEANAAFREIVSNAGNLVSRLARLSKTSWPLKKLSKEETLHHFELQLTNMAGETIWVEVKLRFWQGADNAGEFYLGTLEEITKKKQDELSWKDSYDRLKSTLEAVPDMLFELDEEGRFYESYAPNDAPLPLPPENFIGRTIYEVLPQEAAEVCIKTLQNAAKLGHPSGAAYPLDMADGRHWFEISISAKKEQKSPKPHFVAAVRDITVNIKAEEALRESENKFRTIIEQLSDGFVLMSEDGTVREWNQAMAAYTGIKPEEAIGKNYRKLLEKGMNTAQLDAKSMASLEEIVRIAFIERNIPSHGMQMDFSAHGLDGQERAMQQIFYPVWLGNKYFLGCGLTDITKHRLAEQKSALLAAIVSSHNVAIISAATDGIINSWNEGAEKLYGYTSDEAIGRYIALITAPEQEEELQEVRQRANNGEYIGPYDTTRRTKRGEDIPVSLSISPIKDSQGNIIGTSSISLDISERKKAGKALQESEARFRTLLANAPLAINMTRGGISLYCNAAFAKMHGLDNPEEGLGHHITDFIAPQCRAQIEENNELRERGLPAPTEYESIGRRKDGTEFPLQISVTKVELEDGPVTLAFLTDISERKQTEEALLKSEERFRMLINNAPVAISMLKQGIRVYSNPAHNRMFGHATAEETYGKPALELVAPSCREQVAENMRKRAEGLPVPDLYETIGLRQDGTEFPINLGITQVELDDGPVTIGIVFDLTERKRAEKALRESEARFRTMMADAPLAINMARNGISLYCNKEFATVFGLENPDEGLDRPIIDFIAPSRQAEIRSYIKRREKGLPAPERYETIGWKKDGTEFPMETAVTRVILEDGSVSLAFLTDITFRKQAEEALKKSEARFRKLINNAPVATIILHKGKKIFSNPAYQRMIGMPGEEEVYGESILKEVAPSSRDFVAENIRKREKGEFVPVSYEARWLRRDDTEFPVYVDVTRVELEEGPVSIVMMQDISERKRTEEALRESEARLRTLIANAPLAICLTRKGHILYNNVLFSCMFGLDASEDIVGQPILEHIAPDSREIIQNNLRTREIGLPAPNEYEVTALRADGAEFPLHIAIGRVDLADGPATMAIISDITERKKTEEAIRENEEKYRQLFEAEMDAIFLIENDTKQVLEANAAATSLFGYTHQELLKLKMTDLSAEPEKTGKAIEMKTGRVPLRWYRKKDGTIFPVEIAANFYNSGGRLVHIAALRDISERLKAEAAIRESESKFRQAIGQSTEGMNLFGKEGKIIEWNSAQEKMTGLTREEVLGKPVWEVTNKIIAPELQTKEVSVNFRNTVMEGLRTGHCRLFDSPREYTIYRYPNREELFVQAIFFPIKMEKGFLIGSVTRDITEQKAAEETIKRRNRELAMFNAIISSTAEEIKPEAILQIACRELAQIFNSPHTYAFVLDESKTSAVVQAEVRAETHTQAEGLVIEFTENDARDYLLKLRKPLLITAEANNPLWNELCFQFSRRIAGVTLIFPLLIDDQVTGGILLEADEPDHFTPQDVSLAAKAVDEITGALARARLAQVQYRLVAAVEQAQEIVIITDPKGTILYTNPAFEKISQFNSAEVLGQNPRIVKSDKHDKAFFDEMWDTINSGNVWHGRIENKKKDGTHYIQESSITPVRNESGQIINFVEVARDVTRELELERQYLHSQKMEAIGQLTAGIAHDFNNLLTAINGFAELLHMELPAGHPSQESAERILYSGRRAADLVRQLLAFSHKQITMPQTIWLNEIVGNIDKMLRRIIGEHIELKTQLADEPWPVKIDPAQIEQVIVNLAVNARDAMPEGGHLLIESSNVILDETYAQSHLDIKQGPYVQLAITDDGIGMSDKVKAHLFEPFFTTKGLGKGTGLGLATVYGIIKQAGGHIWVYSEEGKGTTFKIYLPRAEEEKISGIVKERESLPGGSETILLVEDDEGVRDIASLILKQQGYNVLVAADGQEALEIAGSEKEIIDLLLSDIVMRGMGGVELAERMAALIPGIKILLMSGYTDDALVQQKILESGVSFLQKPFSPMTLAQKIRQTLQAPAADSL